MDTTIPLLLSKDALKKAETNINFVNDSVTMFGEKQDVIIIIRRGHYAIPLNDGRKIVQKIENQKDFKINLFAEPQMDKRKIIVKLHSQFAHPTNKKLVQLLKREGLGKDSELV